MSSATTPETLFGSPNAYRATRRMATYFARFIQTIDVTERDDFFHGANRDAWTREFAAYLERQIDAEHPSND